MEPYTVPSYLSKMLSTNNEAPIKIAHGDRRYNMYDMDNKEYASCEDYFCELSDII